MEHEAGPASSRPDVQQIDALKQRNVGLSYPPPIDGPPGRADESAVRQYIGRLRLPDPSGGCANFVQKMYNLFG